MKSIRGEFSEKIFYLPIIILIGYLIIRLINQAQILWVFPLDSKNDLPTYLIFIYWLKIYGYHAFVPQWLNGFILFDVYPPGWAFFAYPIYLLTNNLLYTGYISLVLNYAIGALIIYLFGKSQKMSFAKITAFFALFFVSPMAVGDFIKQGRMPEMLAWLLFIALSIFIFHYKDRKIDWKFLFCAPLYAALIITHQAELILFSFLIMGLLLTRKDIKEAIIVVMSFMIGILLSSFWLITFFKRLNDTTILQLNAGRWLLDFSSGFKLGNIALIIMPLLMISLFYIYWASNRYSKKELLFFSPILILVILILFRLTLVVPILKNVYPDPYQLFILFFIVYFLLKIDYSITPGYIKGLLKTSLVLLPILFIIISVLHTPWFIKHSSISKELISILPYINGPFITLGPFPAEDAFQGSIAAYAAIYYNINSTAGYNYIQANPQHWRNIQILGINVAKKDCNGIYEYLIKTKTTDSLAYGETCSLLESCGLYKKIKKEHFCLYNTKK